MDLDNLSPESAEALDELVHEQASQLASNVINSGESLPWLIINGWTPEGIIDRLREMVTDTESV